MKRILLFLAIASIAQAEITISVPKQTLTVDRQTFKVSTSRFGTGDRPGSFRTPTGLFRVTEKIGAKAKEGAVFRHRKLTGEVVKPNAPGRTSIVTRIIRIAGLEKTNRNTEKRGVYIHGTPREDKLGRPHSIGCVIMSSKDIIKVFNKVVVGTTVRIIGEIPKKTLVTKPKKD